MHLFQAMAHKGTDIGVVAAFRVPQHIVAEEMPEAGERLLIGQVIELGERENLAGPLIGAGFIHHLVVTTAVLQ